MTVNRSFPRPDAALLDAYRTQAAATLHEAMGKRGAMSFPIKPLYAGMKVCGPALTVRCAPGDNLMVHAAMSLIEPGDVLVVDFHGNTEAGPWGDVLTAAAQARGVAGLVIDGCVRDAALIRQMGFPVFARGTNMKGTTKMVPAGDVNVPIVCGSVPVQPGDIVVGDDDGVVVVPQAEAAEVLEKARARDRLEDEMVARIRAGETTVQVLGLEKYLAAMGVEL